MKTPSSDSPVPIDPSKSPTPGIEASSLPGNPAKQPARRDITEATLEALFERAQETEHFKSVRPDKAVLKKLLDDGYNFFIDEKTGRSVVLNKDNIRALIEQSLRKSPVTVRVAGKRSTVEEFHASENRLKDAYGLTVLRVAPPYAEDSGGNPPPLGKQAAALFSELIRKRGATPKVGIGGGRTLRQMTFWLTPPQSDLVISAINYATRISDDELYDSSYLAMNVHWLCTKSKARILSLPPLPSKDPHRAVRWHSEMYRNNGDIARIFHESLDLDIIFVGTGNFDPGSPSISRVYRHLGIDYDVLAKMDPPPVGDINLCFFDSDGNDITPRIVTENLAGVVPEKVMKSGTFFDKEPFCHSFLVGMNIACLKHLVANGKTVVLVAGGEGTKTEAIHALLRARIVNGLVTDAITMDNLLQPDRLAVG